MSDRKRGKKDFAGPRYGGDDDMGGYGGFNDPTGLMAYDMQEYSTRQPKATPETEVIPFFDVKYDNGPEKK